MRIPGVAAGLILVAGCTLPNQDTGPAPTMPPCVSGFHAGETLAVKLGVTYDAYSDFVFDPMSVRGGGQSCNGVDGLNTGVTVTLQLGPPLPDAALPEFGCAPYARFTPSSLVSNSDLVGGRTWNTQGVTLSANFAEHPYMGMSGYQVIDIVSPSRNILGTLTPRKLPPLVVTRTLDIQNFMSGCFDAWVATWDPAP